MTNLLLPIFDQSRQPWTSTTTALVEEGRNLSRNGYCSMNTSTNYFSSFWARV